MNIVAESKKHKTPESLAECLKPDLVTNNLWVWAERLEKLGKVLFWLIIVFGIIVTLTASITSVEVKHGTSYYSWTETETHFSFEIFFTGIFDTALYAFIEYCAYHVLALLISALANITQSTKVAAQILEYSSLKQYPEEVLEGSEVSRSTQAKTESRQKREAKCQMCGAENVELILAAIVDDSGKRYRYICDSCFEKYNCKPL